MSNRAPRFKDDAGNWVYEGDTVKFAYGIPPVHVVGKVFARHGTLYVYTPDHNPTECPLRSLRYHVRAWWKEVL